MSGCGERDRPLELTSGGVEPDGVELLSSRVESRSPGSPPFVGHRGGSVLGWNRLMRLWTLHPRHLDAAGLVALWREALLAQAVLLGRTRGYTRHPQLQRFQAAADPTAFIGAYLRAVAAEATARGYSFDAARIVAPERAVPRLPETKGQLLHEWEHLGRKLQRRSPAWYRDRVAGVQPTAHPLFRIVAGGIRDWERNVEADGTRGSEPASGARSSRRNLAAPDRMTAFPDARRPQVDGRAR